ncbi:MAG: hypothetical protein B6I34_11070 [Anaerolineaceae bacterium 4572_32.1]|nr:MAG: hypothetical protein B6I34_11070 [Anaerolineaceae bacterium 4572_32.1]
MPKEKDDSKKIVLQQHGCLHPHPEKVTDELFVLSEFFDPRDFLQVKYEMLRRVHVDKRSVSESAASFGLSRPSFYQAQKAYEEGGLQALLPRKPGPRRAHKLSEEVMDVLRTALVLDPELGSMELAQLVEERFGFSVHRRSIERALDRQKKKHW